MPKYAQYKFTDNYQKIAVPLSLLLFFISFATTAFYVDYPDDAEYSSAFVFGLGWMGFMAGNFMTTFLWLANPVYVLAIILSGFNKKVSALIGLLAVVLALAFLAVDGIATSESGNGPFYKITAIGTGYWLWLAAIVILIFGNAMSYLNYKNRSA
jgi:hypothetical protein